MCLQSLATLHKVIGTLVISEHLPTRKELCRFIYIPIIAWKARFYFMDFVYLVLILGVLGPFQLRMELV